MPDFPPPARHAAVHQPRQGSRHVNCAIPGENFLGHPKGLFLLFGTRAN
jgi:hypothetical protein